MQVGDYLYIDGIYYQILEMDDLYYEFQVDTSILSPGTTRGNVEVKILEPPPGTIYWIEGFGVSGAISVQVLFPGSTPRGTPKGTPIYLDQTMASKFSPYPMLLPVLPSMFPSLNISAPSYWNGSASVWFFGKKLKVKTVPASSVPAGAVIHKANTGIGGGA